MKTDEAAIDCQPYATLLEELRGSLPAVPRNDLQGFLIHAATASRRLPSQLGERLDQFRTHSNHSGYLLLRGLPIVQTEVPETPRAEPEPAERPLMAAEAWLALLGSRLGLAIGYRESWHGSVLQDVVPSPSVPHPPVGAPLSALRFHTDLPYHRHQPDYVMLACSRTDPGRVAATMVASARRVIPQLAEADRRLLHDELIPCRVDPAFRDAHSTPGDVRVRVLSGPQDDPHLAYDRELLDPGTDATRAVLHRLSETVDRTATGEHWQAGDVLIVDARRTTYACVPYTTTWDGRDRWLHRLFIRDPLRHTGAVVPFAPAEPR
ncbi:Clavaminate synthase 2 (plasmid) [Streptomyces sp. YIM 121038]|uniref:TauD/TfdA family dioxygenase n=1 Tax=Streptomyces sp. YIM 121038 TaxID=2136401 RepID=UPI001162DC29|nr:TauD/TfdA family dioxygenase [Streptomyces sp. YIM 121038]QCX82941.1 Clavaminate synthase 2 [Streptomyces sp. YIM 121038]